MNAGMTMAAALSSVLTPMTAITVTVDMGMT